MLYNSSRSLNYEIRYQRYWKLSGHCDNRTTPQSLLKNLNSSSEKLGACERQYPPGLRFGKKQHLARRQFTRHCRRIPSIIIDKRRMI